ncbi:hypothetical protein EJM73_06325 [Clostridium botulinum]|uniref:hypothetical protein n=1 Tax=Clostridium botulinum TaxID=1491 RepID=UPI0007E2486B|nr:hypothetical protein [Clostridium botulinum]KEI84138.1 hypothetical protein N493_19810 [Clostridium botulinum B2 433]NCI20867.1 hypothetical protein [Clostridium botulinum]NCI35281.1 hypothetical protein [Clostridium botulinum]NCI72127.1 hypothetical protein [Clostridium botulinum]NDI38240.1 hypothetical protein [Clostridium botulinum]
MKKYRLAYDYLFLPNDLNNGIYYKNENITDIAIYMVFKVIDKLTGEEVYFQHKDLTEQTLEYAKNKLCYVNNFYKCVIDENEIFKIIPNEKLLKESNYTVLYEIGECFKWLGSDNPVLIEYEEFINILKNNLSEFNNSGNKPTQSTSYYAVEIV